MAMINHVYFCEKEDYEHRIANEHDKEIYMVDNPQLKKFVARHTSIEKLIHKKCARKQAPFDFATIEKMFATDDDMEPRYYRPWIYTGNWKWIFSYAYGVACGYHKFSFPWMHHTTMDYQWYRIRLILQFAKEHHLSVVFYIDNTYGVEKWNAHVDNGEFAFEIHE